MICVAKHSETLEDMVIYQDVSDPDKRWARPAYMWNETVEADGRSFKRFEMEELTMAGCHKV